MSPERQSVALAFLFSLSIVNLAYIGWHWKVRFESPSDGLYCENVHVSLVTRTNHQGVPAYHAHDFPENLPIGDLPFVSMTDEESAHYPILGKFSDAEWFSMADEDAGSGYLRLGPEDRIFAVSMYHQMHCLRMLNVAFTKARIASSGHLHHCLNYLRQGALCNADLSLEPGDFEMRNFEREKIGATHTCRDWSQSYQVMNENYSWWTKKSGRCVEIEFFRVDFSCLLIRNSSNSTVQDASLMPIN